MMKIIHGYNMSEMLGTLIRKIKILFPCLGRNINKHQGPELPQKYCALFFLMRDFLFKFTEFPFIQPALGFLSALQVFKGGLHLK